MRGSIVVSDLIYAYTGATNTTFTRAGGSVAEHAGRADRANLSHCLNVGAAIELSEKAPRAGD